MYYIQYSNYYTPGGDASTFKIMKMATLTVVVVMMMTMMMWRL
jgi:hypothetical protein